jgi:hypothetical protein
MKKNIAGAASAVTSIAVIAAAGCATGTTVREVPAAPAPVNLAEQDGETFTEVITS